MASPYFLASVVSSRAGHQVASVVAFPSMLAGAVLHTPSLRRVAVPGLARRMLWLRAHALPAVLLVGVVWGGELGVSGLLQ